MSAAPPHASLAARDGALRENWYIACLSKELGAKRPLRRVIYDQPLALFRDSEGHPVCVPDRCLHRHAQISQGMVIDGCLACPYHGWTYGSDGRVVTVPSMGGEKPPADLKLPQRPAVEQDECIWVWMGDSKPSGSPPFRFPRFTSSRHGHYFMITDFDGEVTNLVENFLDVPHTVFVHKTWFRKAASQRVPITVETTGDEVLVTYHQSGDKIGFSGRILNPRGEPMEHTDRFIMPNLTRVDYRFGTSREFIIISQCTPVSTRKSRVYTAIIYRLGAWTRPLTPFLRWYTRVVIQQDVDIMANQTANLAHDPVCRFHGTDADRHHEAIETLRETAARGESPPDSLRGGRQEAEIWI